ncbi:DUF2799 domain-containing protein [Vibrio astriarenae]|uniref:DUF2799 domain-containing protein n=1 Tax=Vibrio astriarenae TaxID=1481923 RepID=A0A7Z2T461_9VIBR|nr:DUF2799 domain-containing protein [Vibrio astriarenae]QIA63940.1 DUF2799 domain-containing protein [Vibrio astriarenae]
MRRICCFAASTVLLGCTPLQGEFDPFQVGFQDGSRGLSQRAMKSVMSESIDGDESAQAYELYASGFQQGRAEFCQVKNAYAWGLKGNRYQDQCKGRASEPQFRYEVERGFQRYLQPEDLAK